MSEGREALQQMREALERGEDLMVRSLDLQREMVANTRRMVMSVAATPGALNLLLDLYAAQVRELAAAEQALLSRGDAKRAIDRILALPDA
jgi:hypothetical protein